MSDRSNQRLNAEIERQIGAWMGRFMGVPSRICMKMDATMQIFARLCRLTMKIMRRIKRCLS